MKISLLIAICLVLFPCAGFAEDIYISQSLQGADSGVNCSNAHSSSWFNTLGNWANPKQTGKIGPGDTAHLCGTITTPLTTKASGSSGSPITILFETGAKYSVGTWTEYTGAITVSGTNYITIDGGTNGIIEATDNGTIAIFGGTKTYNRDIYGIYINASSNVIVKNITIRNIYDRLAGSSDCFQLGRGIQVVGNSNNITFDKNTVSDASLVLSVVLSNTSNITVKNNTVRDGGVGINIAPGNTNVTGSGIVIYGNDVRGGSKWDGTWTCSTCSNAGCTTYCSCGDPHVHQDGLHIFSQGVNGWVDGVSIYNNYLQDFGTHSTAHIYVEKQYVRNILIYNNVVINTGTSYAANGMISVTGSDNAKIFNNTLSGTDPSHNIGIYIGSDGSKLPQNVSIENNILTGIRYLISYASGSTFSALDYNDYYNGDATPFYDGSFHNWAWWQSQGYDAHGMIANPQLDVNYKLKNNSLCINSGIDLSSYFTTDKDGNKRPNCDFWDIGAYEFQSLVCLH